MLVLYLIYGKIHSYKDGNGRISRLLFIENPSSKIYFPLSTLLSKSICDKVINSLYKLFNVKYISFLNNENSFINYPPAYRYLNYNITEKIVNNILHCIINSIVFKYLFVNTKNLELTIKILINNICISRINNYYNIDILKLFDFEKWKKCFKKHPKIIFK